MPGHVGPGKARAWKPVVIPDQLVLRDYHRYKDLFAYAAYRHDECESLIRAYISDPHRYWDKARELQVRNDMACYSAAVRHYDALLSELEAKYALGDKQEASPAGGEGDGAAGGKASPD